MKIDLGKVAVTAAGNWKNNKSYEALTMVVNEAASGGDGCGYISLKNNIGVRPGTDPTTWMKATEAGQSIYDLCVARGYSGTEDEFVQAYNDAVQAAVDAAASAAHAEEVMEEAEEGRALAEQGRAEAEQQRAENEEQRKTAERQRRSAEEGRAEAEEGRTQTFSRQSQQMAAALELADEKTTEASEAAEAATEAAAAASAAAATTAQMNAGLIGLKVEDGELILVQNSETGTVTGGEIDENGMVNIEFEV